MVERVGYSNVAGRGRGQGRGSGRHKNGRDNRSWGKGEGHSFRRGTVGVEVQA